MQREIDTVIKKIQSGIYDMDSKHLTMIDKQEKAVNQIITDIEQIILDPKKLLSSSDFNLYADYKRRDKEFRSLPAQFQVTFPTFIPQEMNKEQIHQ